MQIFKSMKETTLRVGKRLFAYDQLHRGFGSQASLLKDVFKYETKKTETDADHVSIPAKAVADAKNTFKKLLAIFIGLFIIGLMYFVANLIEQNWIVATLALIFSVLCLSFAFRYHFWIYQINKRTLGLTFADYYRDEIESRFGKKKPKPPVNKDSP